MYWVGAAILRPGGGDEGALTCRPARCFRNWWGLNQVSMPLTLATS